MQSEIKEVIIKTRVEKEPHPAGNYEMQMKQLEDLKKEVLRNCEQMINKVIKKQSSR